MSSKKKSPAKKSAATPRRWSLGVFQSKSGDPIVTYCKTDGTVAPYMAAKVTTKKARAHGVFTNMTFSQARAKLLKHAGGRAKAAKKTSSKEGAPALKKAA